MTSAALLARMANLTRRMRPDMARSILQAFERIRGALTDAELIRFVEGLERFGAMPLSETQMEAAFHDVRLTMREGVARSYASFGRDIPKAPSVQFDVLNPRVVTAIRQLETRVITTLRDDIRESVRQHVQAGLEAGSPPRTIARGLRSVIGLAPNQEQAVRNFRRKLEGLGNPLENKLRDRRFDAAIKKGNLTPEQIEKMTEAYRRKFIGWNADVNSKTATLDANRLGQHLSWHDAVDKGVVAPDRIKRTWVTVGDAKVRPEHVQMNGEEVMGLDTPFSNGEVIPGSSTYNCRCLARVSIVAQQRVAA